MAVRLTVLGGERFAEFLGEQPARVRRGKVQGRGNDMDRALAGQLHEVLPQVRLHRPDARRL